MAHLARMRRLMAAIAVVLFVMGGAGDAYGRHLCPHHDGPVAAQLAQAASAHAGHGAKAVGASHGATVDASHGATSVDASHGATTSHESDAHGCTCLGDCTGVSAAVGPVASGVLLEVVAPSSLVLEPAYDALIVRQRPAHFLPWSNAPPQLV